jgi:hypothetical protein
MPTPMIDPISVWEPRPAARNTGAEVPDDRGDEQREHHGETGAGADLQDELDR